MSLELTIRRFDWDTDREVVEDFESKCEIGPNNKERPFLVADTMGDPLCRIRHSPAYEMLVAELGAELVGIVRGSIKTVVVGSGSPSGVEACRVGYILGLRVSPLHRRRGIGCSLVRRMEQWFAANLVDYVYMATEKDNEASVKLFTDKLGFIKFRTPVVLVNPVGRRPIRPHSGVEIRTLGIHQAESLYRRFMGSADFFPHDIDRILASELSLGTWVACPRGESIRGLVGGGDRHLAAAPPPSSWAMLSVWDCSEVFKLRVARAPRACVSLAKVSRLIDRALPWLGVPAVPNVFGAFGLYFVYGVHSEGRRAGLMVRSLCHFVHNVAAARSKDCRVIVTELAGCDANRAHVPHWKLLSCSEDLWCIKSLREGKEATFLDWAKAPPPATLFVDPREV